ncbi:hypothetical protein E4U43_003156 [Claviceps pusilla]|uniref:Uncharacterized protein n=1 Tax=Claviceps pusilla TaxID=123648 RepID=A0A9P7N7S7_9HYPO|nr:hypothetical protein E4U43_003156 [Claviceps pusilla]
MYHFSSKTIYIPRRDLCFQNKTLGSVADVRHPKTRVSYRFPSSVTGAPRAKTLWRTVS